MAHIFQGKKKVWDLIVVLFVRLDDRHQNNDWNCEIRVYQGATTLKESNHSEVLRRLHIFSWVYLNLELDNFTLMSAELLINCQNKLLKHAMIKEPLSPAFLHLLA